MLYRLLFRLLLSRMDAEHVHSLTLQGLRLIQVVPGLTWLLGRLWAPSDPRLRTNVFGVEFPSPVGLAAGFDKDARVHRALAAFGFGFVEVGTVTGQPQQGNPTPRLFRLPEDRALINRMGFNNAGSEAVRNRLAGRRRGVLGVNIGKTKVVPAEEATADYVTSTQRLAPLADYLVVNVSSPNTPGLRDLQAVEQLRPLLSAVLAAVPGDLPVLVKIAPDLADEDVDAVADLAVELGLAGIIATNTTIGRAGLQSDGAVVQEVGGLSGAPLKARSLEVLRRLHRRVGEDLALVSVGGIETADEAWARITAGASLVQGYTGLVYGGPGWPRNLNVGIAEHVTRAGFTSVADAVGSAA